MKGILTLLVYLLAGEVVSFLCGRVIPGNVFGMILLFAALRLGLVREQTVKGVSEFLTRNMAIMFLPAGAGLMVTGGILKDNWVSVSVATLASTLLVMGVVGLIAQKWGRGDGSDTAEADSQNTDKQSPPPADDAINAEAS